MRERRFWRQNGNNVVIPNVSPYPWTKGGVLLPFVILVIRGFPIQWIDINVSNRSFAEKWRWKLNDFKHPDTLTNKAMYSSDEAAPSAPTFGTHDIVILYWPLEVPGKLACKTHVNLCVSPWPNEADCRVFFISVQFSSVLCWGRSSEIDTLPSFVNYFVFCLRCDINVILHLWRRFWFQLQIHLRIFSSWFRIY
jgi:hypothetical protein